MATWWNRNQRKIAPYLFLFPFFCLLAVFVAYPLFYSLQLSFFKIEGIGVAPEPVGFRNYTQLLQDQR